MYKVKNDQTIQRIVKGLCQLGIWRHGDGTTVRERARKFFYFVHYILFCVFMVTCVLVVDDRSESIFLAECTISFVVTIIKLNYLLWKQDEISAFIDNPIFVHTTDCRDKWEQITKKQNNFTKFANACLWTLLVAAGFASVCCLPIFTSQRNLPLFISYTLEWKYSEIIYYISYGFVISGMFGIVVFTSANVIFWYVTFNYSVAYEMLGCRLSRLGVGRKKQPPFATYNEELIELIETHQSIYKYTFV